MQKLLGEISQSISLLEKRGKYSNLSFWKLPVEILGSQKSFSSRETLPRARGLAPDLEAQAQTTKEGRTLGWMNQRSSSMTVPKHKDVIVPEILAIFPPSQQNP